MSHFETQKANECDHLQLGNRDEIVGWDEDTHFISAHMYSLASVQQIYIKTSDANCRAAIETATKHATAETNAKIDITRC